MMWDREWGRGCTFFLSLGGKQPSQASSARGVEGLRNGGNLLLEVVCLKWRKVREGGREEENCHAWGPSKKVREMRVEGRQCSGWRKEAPKVMWVRVGGRRRMGVLKSLPNSRWVREGGRLSTG
jgi:hypothetical protein